VRRAREVGHDLNVFYTPTEAARLLKVHERTIRRLIDSGKLGAVKVAGRKRISEEHLESFLEENAIRSRVKQTEQRRRGRRDAGLQYKVFEPV
jgi:excisionase family DNA binding protein